MALLSPAPCLVLGRNPHLCHHVDLWDKERQCEGVGTGKLLPQSCCTSGPSSFKSQDGNLGKCLLWWCVRLPCRGSRFALSPPLPSPRRHQSSGPSEPGRVLQT